MSDLPSQKRYAPWVPIGSPTKVMPFVQLVNENVLFFDDDEYIANGDVINVSANWQPSSQESFWVQRAKPVETHKPTRFDVEIFVGLNEGPSFYEASADRFDDLGGGTQYLKSTLKCAYDTAFPWWGWSDPEAEVPRTAAIDQWTGNYTFPLSPDQLKLSYRMEDPQLVQSIYFYHSKVFGSLKPSPEPVDFEQVDRLARSGLINKLAEGDVNISVFLAEFPEGWRWLATMGTRLLNGITALLSGNIPKAISAFRVKESRRQRRLRNSGKLASWDDFILEYNYALTPLLSDLYGFFEAYLNGLQTEGNLVHVRSFVSDEGAIRDMISWGRENKPKKAYGRMNFRPATLPAGLEPSVAVSYVCTYRVIDARKRSLQELGLLNPLEVAWEKIPFSFLIDWLINFRSILSSVTADAGLEFVDGCKTSYSISPISFSESDNDIIAENFLNVFKSENLDPEFGGEFVYRPASSLGYMMKVKREPLDDFEISVSSTKLAFTIDPIKNDARLLSFLALFNKALS